MMGMLARLDHDTFGTLRTSSKVTNIENHSTYEESQICIDHTSNQVEEDSGQAEEGDAS